MMSFGKRQRAARACAALVAVFAVAALGLKDGRAWEAATTHAGLSEQAALASRLHQHLVRQMGVERGLFAALTVPPADAPELFTVLRTLDPTHGYVPDNRGRLLALGWLAAGSVVADVPAAHAAHHFYDPASKSGLSDQTVRGLSAKARHAIASRRAADGIVRQGMPAVEWITHPDNPMNLAGFMEQYRQAVASVTPAERSRHVAGMLLAAGAMLHVLQDMGSPSHVRDDLAAHLDVVGNDRTDVGSRFERIAALAYGRLGVPAPGQPVSATSVQALFSTEKHEGLADRTSQRWFSAYTLPAPIRLVPRAGASAMAEPLAKSLARPHPAPLPALDLDAARSTEGARLTDAAGVCVANYRLREHRLSWSMDDACMAEQIAVILPEVGAYSAGLLDYLFRGALVIELEDPKTLAVKTTDVGLGAGTIQVFWDDARGVRTALAEPRAVERADANQELMRIEALPKGANALAVLFSGVDQAGQPLVAAGYVSFQALQAPRTNDATRPQP